MSVQAVPTMSALKAFNRPHTVDEATADFLYCLYELLRRAPSTVDKHARQRTFESAALGSHTWRIVCISRNALEHVVATRSVEKLKRAHALSRGERYDDIFGARARSWSKQDLT
jgi:peptidoglycan/xylan/chitin deacetylase (PgdA/CDA1 family)